jgi:LmbE family N-acetylglucosaminyl deacetylase
VLTACLVAASALVSNHADEPPIDMLVLAPHPDDEVLVSAGIAQHAREAGRTVRFVYVTNGDFDTDLSEGYLRQGEAVAGAAVLGADEEDLVFLGYPDGYLTLLSQSYPHAGDQFVGPTGQGVTYGNRGLGGADYHTYRFGAPAAYNRANVVSDLEDLLSTWKPRHIFVTSEWDKHGDHATTYGLLQSALADVMASDPAWRPTVHKTIVWSDSPGQPHLWPEPAGPTTYHVPPPSLSETPLVWSERESIDVPVPMQSTILGDNPKHQAIAAHGSQGGASGFLGRFLHKDEFFWVENPAGSNHPPRVDAGPGQTVAEGELVTLDGTGSTDADGTPLTYQWAQAGGIPVTLSAAASAFPSFVAPSGLTSDENLTFELEVSDGELVSIADLVTVTVVATSPHIAPANIAPLAVVTASSENPGDGQLAVKAVDGVADGWPGDYTREWATAGQTTGAWIELTWTRPYSVSRVVVFDRPNGEDQILGATLSFSDGSTETLGPLDDSGAGNELVFAARLVTSLRLTVTSTSGSTQNVGLAELQVFRTPSPDVDGDGWTVADGDCGDLSASVRPGAIDATCNGIDENCSGAPDEGYAPQATSCGIGACGASGATSCVAGQVVDSCVPGSPSAEACDGVDNDCNGAIDDAPVPLGVPSLGVDRSKVSWTSVAGATGYDVVRGSLVQLRTTGGNFSVATEACLGSDLGGTSLSFSSTPPSGQGWWFLMRPVSCGGAGSYDEGVPSQVGSRDAEIASSPQACP